MVKQNNIQVAENPEKKIISNDIKKKEILKQRAELLKINTTSQEIEGNKLEGLVFILSNESYVIESSYITSVISLKEITPLPCTPDFILGIINVNGRILAVLNIKDFLNLPKTSITNLNRVILLKYSDIELGVLVDSIIGSTPIYPDKLQLNIPSFKETKNNFLVGITENRLIFLDVKRILTNEAIMINDEV